MWQQHHRRCSCSCFNSIAYDKRHMYTVYDNTFVICCMYIRGKIISYQFQCSLSIQSSQQLLNVYISSSGKFYFHLIAVQWFIVMFVVYTNRIFDSRMPQQDMNLCMTYFANDNKENVIDRIYQSITNNTVSYGFRITTISSNCNRFNFVIFVNKLKPSNRF